MRNDRTDLRKDRADLRQDVKNGDMKDAAKDRRDFRHDARDMHPVSPARIHPRKVCVPPEQLAANILKKEERIAEIMGNIRNLLAKHSA